MVERVTNGGFETGDFTGWTEYQNSTVSSSVAHAGTYSNRIYVSGDPGPSAGTYQFINLTNVDSLSFWYYIGTNSGNWASAYWLDSSSNAVTFASNSSHDTVGVWHQIIVDTSMYSGSTQFQIQAAAGVPSPPAPSPIHGTIEIYFDDISAISTPPMQINISDSWKEVDTVKINIGDAWKDVVSIKQNIGDTWKTVF